MVDASKGDGVEQMRSLTGAKHDSEELEKLEAAGARPIDAGRRWMYEGGGWSVPSTSPGAPKR